MLQFLNPKDKLNYPENCLVYVDKSKEYSAIIVEGSSRRELIPERPSRDWFHVGTQLLPMSESVFVVADCYEHTKGANREEFLSAYSLSSSELRPLWFGEQFCGYRFDAYLHYSDKEWFWLVQDRVGHPDLGIMGYMGCDLVAFRLSDALEVVRFPICYPEELLHVSGANLKLDWIERMKKWGGLAKLVEKNGKTGIELAIKMVDDKGYEHIFTPLSVYWKDSEAGEAPPA